MKVTLGNIRSVAAGKADNGFNGSVEKLGSINPGRLNVGEGDSKYWIY